MKTLGMENVGPTAVDVSISAFKTCKFVGEGRNLHCQDGDFNLYTNTQKHTRPYEWYLSWTMMFSTHTSFDRGP